MSRSTVHIDIHFAASMENVWRAWTNPAILTLWYGSDPAGTVEKADLDVRPGGKYEITFHNADGEEHSCFGTYEQVEPYHALSFTWAWVSEPGQPSKVTVRLTPDAKSTHMAFTHADVWSNSAHGYEEGWMRTFEKLKKALQTMAQPL